MSWQPQRMAAAAAGLFIVVASTFVPWVHVDLAGTRSAAADLVEERLDLSVEDGVAAGLDAVEDATGQDLEPLVDVVEGTAKVAEAVDRALPDGLTDALDGGRTANEMFGFGIGLALVALGAALAVAASMFWAQRFFRVLAVVGVVLLCVAGIAFALGVYALEPAARWLLPDEWEPFRPMVSVGIGPGVLLVGAVVIGWSAVAQVSALVPAAQRALDTRGPVTAKPAASPIPAAPVASAPVSADPETGSNPWL